MVKSPWQAMKPEQVTSLPCPESLYVIAITIAFFIDLRLPPNQAVPFPTLFQLEKQPAHQITPQ